MILGDIVDRNARLSPNQEGLVDERCRLTFAELAERSRRLANAMAARGLKPGDRIAVLAPNSHETVEVFNACELAGFIATAINARLSVAELVALLSDCTPAALVFDMEFKTTIDAIRPSIPFVKVLLSVGGAYDGAEDYEKALAGASSAAPATSAKPEDTAFIIYTSGSTGRPQGRDAQSSRSGSGLHVDVP